MVGEDTFKVNSRGLPAFDSYDRIPDKARILSKGASMTNKTKLAVGAALATIGGLGIVLSLVLGWTSLPRPWSFIVGFGFGLSAGLGSALAIAGLCMSRHER